MVKETVKLNYLHIAPRKVRLLANVIKGLPVNEAEAQLYLRPQRASKPLLKLLRSAVANAKHNQKADVDKLVVSSIWVDQGPVFKRFLPRAMGRATPIRKKTSHVTLILTESEKKFEPKFNVVTEQPKVKKEKKVKKAMPKAEIKKEMVKPKEKAGFFKRFFQRKSV
jgi:large subunit ribosomal protein L22